MGAVAISFHTTPIWIILPAKNPPWVHNITDQTRLRRPNPSLDARLDSECLGTLVELRLGTKLARLEQPSRDGSPCRLPQATNYCSLQPLIDTAHKTTPIGASPVPLPVTGICAARIPWGSLKSRTCQGRASCATLVLHATETSLAKSPLMSGRFLSFTITSICTPTPVVPQSGDPNGGTRGWLQTCLGHGFRGIGVSRRSHNFRHQER
ncbi:hypothetical protein B0I37DRAFT_381699 [Chaetomium sp. MPI-CAGE-AT-0009]|nr:hypothetical protein B0I37DRAFT_381699 [Chaetomium sp. MPI-CAGE-AT-0009]